MKFTCLIALTCILFIWGCKTSQENIVIEKGIISPVEYVQNKFDTVYVQGDSLFASVIYSGGCATHSFTLELNGPLLKSLPPKQPLMIVHRSDEDPCRALIIENLKFDISSFRGTPSGTTVLLLENWNQHLSYSY